MTHIRAFAPGDEPALAQICLLTADAGGDATGILEDDAIWANVFVLPYVAHAPDFAFVVEGDEGELVGFIVVAPDTDRFEDWFHDSWWPQFTRRWPEPATDVTRHHALLKYAYARRGGINRYAAEYPAHLHIDLLPHAQGAGWGRRLIETGKERLREAGVPGLHLLAVSDNTGALKFYSRVGFTALPSEPGVQAFGMTL